MTRRDGSTDPMCANLHARSQRGRQTPQYADPLAVEALALARTTNANFGEALALAQNLADQVADLRHKRAPRLIQRTRATQLTLPDIDAQLVLWAS